MPKAQTTPELARTRAAQIIIYDLQGGPFPEKAVRELERAVEKIVGSFDGLAITMVVE